jgi:hypothetical protein
MEQGLSTIIVQGGRQGSWFTYNDGTDGGVQTPTAGGPCFPSLIPDGGRCGSLHAMHTFGSGFTSYGAGLGFNLNQAPGGMLPMPYDAMGYNGIAFWALGPASGSLEIQVEILTSATTPVSAGGECVSACDDHFYLAVQFPSTGWAELTVPLAAGPGQLAQQGFGTPATFDKTKLLAVQFVSTKIIDPSDTFDFWVDDIGFY